MMPTPRLPSRQRIKSSTVSPQHVGTMANLWRRKGLAIVINAPHFTVKNNFHFTQTNLYAFRYSTRNTSITTNSTVKMRQLRWVRRINRENMWRRPFRWKVIVNIYKKQHIHRNQRIRNRACTYQLWFRTSILIGCLAPRFIWLLRMTEVSYSFLWREKYRFFSLLRRKNARQTKSK